MVQEIVLSSKYKNFQVQSHVWHSSNEDRKIILINSSNKFKSFESAQLLVKTLSKLLAQYISLKANALNIYKSSGAGVFPVIFAKFVVTPFLTEHPRWLLLIVKKVTCKDLTNGLNPEAATGGVL